MQHLGIISLGSNQGNRVGYLQKGVQRLIQTVGPLERLSPIYETPALGFEGGDFLNACASFKTDKSPQQLMEILLSLEQESGRKRSLSGNYESRTLDLDLLFYDEVQIDTTTLVIPHPRLHLRNFVLFPLADIYPEFIHPGLESSVEKLRLASPDSSALHKQPYQRWTPPVFDRFPNLIFEGNIGVGKSTLAKMVASRFQVAALLESFEENPHLVSFYKDPKKYSFKVEKHFLTARYQQLKSFLQQSIEKQPWVADFGFHKSSIFAGVNLSGRELVDFEREFKHQLSALEPPSLWVYLHRPLEELEANIRKRSRAFEQQISAKYLQKIESSYQDFIQAKAHFKILEIDCSEVDFQQDAEAFQRLLFTIYAV